MRLDDKILEFKNDLLVMATRVRKNYETVFDALLKFDKEKALIVVEMDDYINHDEKSINDLAIEILSLLQPVASDLRLIVGGIKIATDLERIGDYAKNIGRYVIKKDEISESLAISIKAIADQFIEYFDEVIQVLKENDVKSAYSVAIKDEVIDSIINTLLQKFADKNNSEFIYNVEEISLVRNIERAGDHAKNICEHVIYIVKGHHVDFG